MEEEAKVEREVLVDRDSEDVVEAVSIYEAVEVEPKLIEDNDNPKLSVERDSK